MAPKEGNPHGCSKDGDLQSHPDRKNCTSVRLNQRSLSKLKCSSYLHLHLSEACTLTGFDVLNTLCPALTSFPWCLLSSRKFFSVKSLQLSPAHHRHCCNTKNYGGLLLPSLLSKLEIPPKELHWKG